MNIKTNQQAVMLIGFGGPMAMDEVRPFLESVLRGARIPQARFDEVVHHYEVIGGVSPYNAVTYAQKKALKAEFARRGVNIPVYVGFRHSSPSLGDVLRQMNQDGIRKVAALVLAPLRSYVSFEKYVERVEEAKCEAQIENIAVTYTEPFHQNPLFIEAQADEVAKVIMSLGPHELEKTFFIFSAHSIPVEMAQKSEYDKHFSDLSRLIAQKIPIGSWCLAYQSRSGNPRDPWLEPSVEKIIKALDRTRYRSVVLVSPGFLCDNVEVIYDLDYECGMLCQELGLSYYRARTVADHPKFIRLAADLLQARL